MKWFNKKQPEAVKEIPVLVEEKMMEESEIRRIKPELPDSIEYREVLEEARHQLGYEPGPEGYRLSEALVKLGIERLNSQDVERYKKERETDTHRFIQYPIEKYKLAIPVHVLNKAIQLKKELPDVQFTVHSYERVGDDTGAGDPFLFASVDRWGHYIEVWEEPEFERKSETDEN